MAREGGLGRGLSSLIPPKKPTTQSKNQTNNSSRKSFSEVDDYEQKISSDKKNERGKFLKERENKKIVDNYYNSVQEVSVDEIRANPYQPRQFFNEEKLNELASSIKKHGVIQPLIVTKRPEGGYELIAGERRFKASRKSGLQKVPVIIKKIGDKEKIEWALIENIQRDDLNAIEEAEAYERLMEKFNYNQNEIAVQVGKSRSTIANTLRLLELSGNLKKLIKSNKISEGHGRALLGLEDRNQREILAEEIIRKRLSVREVERKVKQINNPVSIMENWKEKDWGIVEIENKISETLGTKVAIKKSRKGGQLILNYYSEEEFDNLFNKLIS
jgi:ParB family chromosome partitioning protein